MCNYISEVPFEGYAEAYLHKYTTPWGKDVEEICLGKPYKGEEDKPWHLEYDRFAYKHLGTVKITITSDDPKINGLKVDSSRISKASDIE